MFDWKSAVLTMAIVLGVATLPEGPQASPQPQATAYADGVVPEKSTQLGLYLSSQEAHAFLQDHPETLFIDTRDPLEISLSGLPVGIDAIVPIKIHSDTYVESRDAFALARNPDFGQMWSEFSNELGIAKDDLIIVTCGNGRRSAITVNELASKGYTNVWHIVDGYAGEEFEDPDGLNTKNAWQLAGLPWGSGENLPGSAWVRLFN